MVVVETHGDVEDETDEDRDESEGGLLFSKIERRGAHDSQGLGER